MTTRRDLSLLSGITLLAAAALLAAVGTGLLAHPPGDAPAAGGHPAAPSTPPGRRPAPSVSPPSPTAPSPRTSRPAPGQSPAVQEAAPSAPAAETASPVPVAGDGPGADAAIQQVLERSSPADLPPAVEGETVALAKRVWRADVTGTGRARWPRYFSATAPARHLYTRVRIQAGIARQAGPGRVVVHLVWAGSDRFGHYREGRTARVLLARIDQGWEPVR